MLSQADVFLHPALHDSAPSSVLEAMAARKPVICLDLAGPSFQIDQKSGIKIKVNSEKQVIKELKSNMTKLFLDKNFKSQMGDNSFSRVKSNFMWGTKSLFIKTVYENILTK